MLYHSVRMLVRKNRDPRRCLMLTPTWAEGRKDRTRTDNHHSKPPISLVNGNLMLLHNRHKIDLTLLSLPVNVLTVRFSPYDYPTSVFKDIMCSLLPALPAIPKHLPQVFEIRRHASMRLVISILKSNAKYFTLTLCSDNPR